MSRTRTREIGVGALLVASLGLLAWMSIQVGALQGMGPAVAVSATLDDAAGLTEGAEVKVAGVAVGVVTRLTVDHDVAVVDFEVRESAGLRRDAIVQVRARSLLGEKYLDVSPQGRDAALLRDGALPALKELGWYSPPGINKCREFGASLAFMNFGNNVFGLL